MSYFIKVGTSYCIINRKLIRELCNIRLSILKLQNLMGVSY